MKTVKELFKGDGNYLKPDKKDWVLPAGSFSTGINPKIDKLEIRKDKNGQRKQT